MGRLAGGILHISPPPTLPLYEDMAAHDKQWSAFGSDPEWKKLSTTPGFTDPEIVSNISNMYLRPVAYSQI